MDFSTADRLLRDGIEAGLFSAAQWIVGRRGEVVAEGAVGRTSFAPTAERVDPDTLFDTASLTKPVVTATATLQLVERGLLTLKDTAGKMLAPAYGLLPHLQAIEVGHLLTHTSGLPPIPVSPTSDHGGGAERQRTLAAALATPLLREPGLAYTYSDTGYVVLWEVASAAAGMPLEACVREHIFAPLRSTSDAVAGNGFWLASAAPIVEAGLKPPSTIVSTDAAVAAGTVHDPRARALGGVSGHAGLFANAAGLHRFAEAIRIGGGPLLSQASALRMLRPQLRPEVGAMSLGWFTNGNDMLPRGDLFSDESVGHSGFTGCLLLIDPAFEMSVVLLTNRVLNTSADGVPFLRLRRAWLNAVAAAAT